ncbi:MAG: hypothetical protein WC508_04790 [Patescibacteria group bacterium]
MKSKIVIILALSIEFILLLVVGLFFLMALLGAILPVIPGVLFLGLGIGLYLLILRSGHGHITKAVHPHLLGIKDKIFNLKVTQKIMGLIKEIKRKKQERVKEEILKNGMILLGFNIALILAFIFGFISLSFLADALNLSVLFFAFIPLIAIFVFAGASSVVWYRFGQIIGARFKDRKAVNASLVVLISILPLWVILLVLSTLVNLTGAFNNDLVVISFISLILMSIFSAAFELIVVSLGSIMVK